MPHVEYNQLAVTGSASLSGTLDASLIDLGGELFAPSVGDSFAVLTAGSGVMGVFSAEILPALGAELQLRVDYLPSAVELVVGPVLPGDFDGNGTVSSDDLAIWVSQYGTTADATLGDADADRDVDGDDFLIWQANLGESVGSIGGLAVPEPGTSLVALIAGIFMACTRIVP